MLEPMLSDKTENIGTRTKSETFEAYVKEPCLDMPWPPIILPGEEKVKSQPLFLHSITKC